MPEFSDEIWKRSIKGLLRSMIRFYFPDLHPLIDWKREQIFCDKELANLFNPRRKGKRFVDALVQIFLLDGTDKYILLHVEVQGRGSGGRQSEAFARRMFRYYYRIWEKWKGKDIVALAILTGGNENFRPDRYETSFFGTSLTYVFNVCRVIDYEEKELEENPNPFATLMLAAKRALKLQRSDDETKKLFKLSVLRLGIERGYTSEELEALFYFVDWVVSFSDEETRDEFVEEVLRMANKEEIDMPYVTSIEEVTRKKTMIQAKLEMARRMLEWGNSDENILACARITPEELARLKERVLQEAH